MAVVAQIVLLRRGIAHFSGNELGVSVGLLCWLMWVGFGSLVARKALPALPNPERLLWPSLLMMAILFPFSVAAFDLVRPVMGVPLGRVVGLGFIGLSYTLLMAPFCITNGGLFTLGSSLLAGGRSHLAFAAESAGAAVGGVVFFSLGWRFFDGLGLSLAVLVLVALSAVRWGRGKAMRVVASAVAAAGLAVLLWQGPNLDRQSTAARYAGFTIAEQSESPLGSLTWAFPGKDVDREGDSDPEATLFYNGSPLFSQRDFRSAELAVHPPLLVHPSPRKVLVVTSHVTGLLEQVLSHPVDTVDVVMTDRAVLELEKRRIPSTKAALEDSRVKAVIGDGRRFLASHVKDYYDVIIVDAPDPDNLGLNRFFSREFFSQAARVLAHDGVLAMSAGEPSNYVPAAVGRYLASIDHAVEPSLKYRNWYPLGRFSMLAGKEPVRQLTGALADGAAVERGLDLRFIRSDYLDADLSEERVAQVRAALASNAGEGANTDILPMAVSNRLLFWRGRTGEAGILALRGTGAPWNVFVVGLALMVLVTFTLAAAGRGGSRGVVLLFLGGFAGIGAESVLLYLYQVGYGYLYSRISLLLAIYMAGLGAGALLRKGWLKRPAWWWTVFFLVLAAAISLRIWDILPEWAGLLFFALAVGSAGALTGVSFAAGARILEECGWRSSGGAAYGFDLAGAAVGALVCGLVLPLAVGLEGPVRLCLLLSVSVAAGMGVGRK